MWCCNGVLCGLLSLLLVLGMPSILQHASQRPQWDVRASPIDNTRQHCKGLSGVSKLGLGFQRWG